MTTVDITTYGVTSDADWAYASYTLAKDSIDLFCDSPVFNPATAVVGRSIYVPGTSPTGLITTLITAWVSTTQIRISTPGGAPIPHPPNSPPEGLNSTFCLVGWGTDNASQFATFTSDHQGADVTLLVPGKYFISYANPLFAGISNLILNGSGSGVSSLVLGVGNLTTFSAQRLDVYGVRARSARKGQNYIDLIDPTKITTLSAGYYGTMTGIATQVPGFPSNHEFFEIKKILALDTNPASPTYGRVTFTEALRNDYLSTWPCWYPGSGDGTNDFGGPAMFYPAYTSVDHNFDARFVINDITIASDAQWGSPGRDVTFNNCIFGCGSGNFGGTGSGPYPSSSVNWTCNNCTATGSGGHMEVDKYVENAVLDSCSWQVIECQSSTVNSFTIRNGSSVVFLDGTTKRVIIDNSTITELLPGPNQTLGMDDEIICSNSTINSFDQGGQFDQGTNGINFDGTMVDGVLTLPFAYRGVGVVPWAIPGKLIFFSDATNMWVEPSAVITEVTQDFGVSPPATRIKFVKSPNIYPGLISGFMPLPSNATKVAVYPCIYPRATFVNCTGTDGRAASLSNAPARTPLWAYQKWIYTSGVAKADPQPMYPVIGKLVRLSINVTHAYGGAGALTFSIGGAWPVMNSVNNSDVPIPNNGTIFYTAVVNCKVPGERVITHSGVTLDGVPGAGSGDSGLTLPDSLLTWFTGPSVAAPAFSADVHVADPNVRVVVTFETDQGLLPEESPSQSQRMGVFVVTY